MASRELNLLESCLSGFPLLPLGTQKAPAFYQGRGPRLKLSDPN